MRSGFLAQARRHGDAELVITAPRDSSRGGSFSFGKPFADGKGEAGKDVAAFKMLVFPQHDRVISIGEDANLPALGIDVPDLKHPGSKVLLELARHLARGVSLAENFHDEVLDISFFSSLPGLVLPARCLSSGPSIGRIRSPALPSQLAGVRANRTKPDLERWQGVGC